MDSSILAQIFIYALTFLLTIYLYRFYRKLNIYPRGPLPLPIIGNLHLLYDRKKHPFLKFGDLAEKYGKVFTFWFGSTPAIIITDCKAGVELFKADNCSGRPYLALQDRFKSESYPTFAFDDYTPEVKHIRKVTIDGMKKITKTENFATIVCDSVDEIVAAIKLKANSSIDPKIYFMPLFTQILAELLFEKKYSFGDQEIEFLMQTNDSISKVGVRKNLVHFVPILKYLNSWTETTSEALINIYLKKLFNTLETYYERCLKLRNNTDKYSNLCSALITSNVELNDGEESELKLDRETIIGAINVLFIAGSDTTPHTILFMVLIMAYYPDIQNKLREEVTQAIGVEDPQLSHKSRLPYLRAFMMETLRFRNVTPVGVPHKNIAETTIFGHLIPPNTMLILHQHSILHDSDYWSNPEQFIPEKFLEANGELITKRLPAFIPFGSGKRICPGEQLAMDIMFLSVVRLMQSTVGYNIVLAKEPPVMDLDASLFKHVIEPKVFHIIFKQNN